MHDETAFTAHGQPGWASWDQWSPEEDFCRFVGLLQRVLQPGITLETGVGIGRITEFLNPAVGSYLGFESDPAWRRHPGADPEQATPTAAQMASADLVILDSDPPFRIPELDLWVSHGKPGSLCVVHDCGNGHPDGTFHGQMGRRVRSSGFPGSMLRNPRGAWMGWHP